MVLIVAAEKAVLMVAVVVVVVVVVVAVVVVVVVVVVTKHAHGEDTVSPLPFTPSRPWLISAPNTQIHYDA